ncbi:hypothetical protein Kpol_541p42 [Vanderwaltozyma polyspora DSM 70294]|uniref:Uncharacterized protein n=1 Tax=Vanderwaltozyma polyspora (strain ATCC 22028 / DSM 70294 / BCRC 21397 / CBS 2163 / NBRC 10782 / NRRL Y-8283 / UCD 57-17) TaxID=436907 RepID=A7TIY8_VANPO|nr:uncharacterized protein Kpol_541p42 [Vanderwaltozyma polyspora DSM 70294]EDO17800.1 hypothetical protein Kpol_541p42 [Vanderwaltozyma polyspora DSM 70294]
MRLKSKLEILTELDLDELLNIQHDVTLLIKKKVRKLLIENNLEDSISVKKKNETDQGDTCDGELVEIDNSGVDIQDFILTQIENKKVDDRNLKSENVIQEVKDPLLEKNSYLKKEVRSSIFPDFSSPLKSYDEVKTSKVEAQSPIKNINYKSINNVKRSLILDDLNDEFFNGKASAKRDKKIYDFNRNPITAKAWILEDFKPNEDKLAIARGRKRDDIIKLKKIYKEIGEPPDLIKPEHDSFDNEDLFINKETDFDNLKTRSRSPPGYGRLDFPNTQERNDDKKKSQEIIFKKTKMRFLQAVRNKIPPQEREFHFKSDELNRIVDDGNFKWDDNKLNIYSRS